MSSTIIFVLVVLLVGFIVTAYQKHKDMLFHNQQCQKMQKQLMALKKSNEYFTMYAKFKNGEISESVWKNYAMNYLYGELQSPEVVEILKLMKDN